MKWYRKFASDRNDPKVQGLPLPLFKFWINLMDLICELDTDGKLPPPEELAFLMRIRGDVLDRFTRVLASSKLIQRHVSGALVISDWRSRQKSSDNGADRIKRYRERTSEKRQQSDVTLHVTGESVTKSVPELELELEEELSHISARARTHEEHLSEVNPPQQPSTPHRNPDDLAEFEAALKTLASDPRSEWLAMELGRRSTLPEILDIPGWKFRRGSEVILSPERTDGQRRSLPYFLAIIRAFRDDERFTPLRTSHNGNGQPRLTPFQQREKRQIDSLRNLDLSKLPEM